MVVLLIFIIYHESKLDLTRTEWAVEAPDTAGRFTEQVTANTSYKMQEFQIQRYIWQQKNGQKY